MAMRINDEYIEIIVPNSEATINAQHNGIVDRSVGSYYMSENQEECSKFLNNLSGKYYIDIPTCYFNAIRFIKKLKDSNYESAFKHLLRPQKSAIETLKWYMDSEKEYLHTIPAPTINENNKYLRFENQDPIFDLIKTLTLGDLIKITIKKIGIDCFVIYIDENEKFDEYLKNNKFLQWIK